MLESLLNLKMHLLEAEQCFQIAAFKTKNGHAWQLSPLYSRSVSRGQGFLRIKISR